MTRNVSCAPCAKRKVRCDRTEPCSNCKRRKNDHCVYPVTTRNVDVRSPTQARASSTSSQVQDQAQARNNRSLNEDTRPIPRNDPLIVRDRGNMVYLESSTWRSWDKKSHRNEESSSTPSNTSQFTSHALKYIINCKEEFDLANYHPTPVDAALLWKTFLDTVNPLTKVSFDCELDQMREITTRPENRQHMTHPEHAFCFAVYLHSVTALSEQDCWTTFCQSRVHLLFDYQKRYEYALAKSEFFSKPDLLLIQATCIYISACFDRLSAQSLSSLMGLVIRQAEKLGLHRDGTILNLSPYETEKRRRIWWLLQHQDMALGVMTGSTSLTLMADWDVKLPLNIEDDDIDPQTEIAPPERPGITDMSYCLWTYYLIEQQRSLRHSDGRRVGLIWVADQSLSREQREAFISQIENGANQKFVQYCDPLRPIDNIILAGTRAFTWTMRRVLLHSLLLSGNSSTIPTEKLEDDLFAMCIRCLEYDLNLYTQRRLDKFRWRTKGFFSWNAFVYVITESSRYRERPGVRDSWDLLDEIYTENPFVSDFDEDPRKFRAAEMVLAAWKAYEADCIKTHHRSQTQRPAFLSNLESSVASKRSMMNLESKYSNGGTQVKQSSGNNTEPTDYTNRGQGPSLIDENSPVDTDRNPILSDIDWSFWTNWQ